MIIFSDTCTFSRFGGNVEVFASPRKLFFPWRTLFSGKRKVNFVPREEKGDLDLVIFHGRKIVFYGFFQVFSHGP